MRESVIIFDKMLEEDNVIDGLMVPGVLPKFIYEEGDCRYYVKTTKNPLSEDNWNMALSEMMAYEIGKFLGFDVTKYELWSVQKDIFKEVRCEDEDGPFSLKRLWENGKILCVASEEFSSWTSFDAESLGFNEKGIKLYADIISSGIFPREKIDQMIIFDLVIGNTDRHLSNFGYEVDPWGKIKILPLYDHGHAFLSTFDDEELEEDREECMSFLMQKPFNFPISKAMNVISYESLEGIRVEAEVDDILRLISPYLNMLSNIRRELITTMITTRWNYVKSSLS